MAEVELSVGGRRYRLSCAAGDEPQLRTAAAHVDARARQLTEALGAMPESRLLLMAALMVTDELFEARAAPSASESTPAPNEALLDAVARLEALADLLEQPIHSDAA